MTEENKIKAVDINIESLKLYLTLSTFAFAGILTFYSSLSHVESRGLFVWAIVLFFSCAVISVVIVNIFIKQAHDNKYNVRTILSITLNFAAIILFFIGIITGSMFVGRNINGKDLEQNLENMNGKIIIENSKITIGENNNMELIIIQDPITSKKVIYIKHD